MHSALLIATWPVPPLPDPALEQEWAALLARVRAVKNAHAGVEELLPGAWQVTVLLETTLEAARARISPASGTLEATPPGETPSGVIFRASGPTLEGAAAYLAGLGFPLRVIDPPALRDALRRHVSRLLNA